MKIINRIVHRWRAYLRTHQAHRAAFQAGLALALGSAWLAALAPGWFAVLTMWLAVFLIAWGVTDGGRFHD